MVPDAAVEDLLDEDLLVWVGKLKGNKGKA